MITTQDILELVQSGDYRPQTAKSLAEKFSLTPREASELEHLLEQMQETGKIIRLNDGRWDDPARHNMLTGRLDLNQRGFGFVIPADPAKDTDIFIPEQELGGAMDGDLVIVRTKKHAGKKGKGRGPSGRIIGILKRAHEKFVGTFHSTGGKKAGAVSPDEPSLETDVIIPRKADKNARNGEKVLVEITHWPEPNKGHEKALGRVIRVFRKEDTPEIDEISIIHQFNLPEEFPENVLAEAARIPAEITPRQLHNRRDLSGLTTIAIDPWNAKDRDDALSMTVDQKTGESTVMVHIADVSCHVSPGCAIDQEARERALSVYLVRSFIPMIPTEATQQKLSLACDVRKPAKTVELHFDRDGELTRSDIFHSTVKLDGEMTYRQVQSIIEGTPSEGADEADQFPENVIELVRNLDDLAGRLRRKRRDLGSVDLDVPEYEVEVGEDGKVSAVSQIERDRSHGLVEEFMLAANVAVAKFFQKNELPAIYRVHEQPDKEDLEAFADFVRTVLDRKIDPYDRGAIQKLLIDVRETNFSEAVNMELLRCMKRAQYTTECAPHFALHFPVYCHFTSPIRRYPDLVIHQILDQHFSGKIKGKKGKKRWAMSLESIARHCSLAESNADKAEREIINLKLLRYLQERGVEKGEVFDGVITGVKEFGFFAQLQEFSIEGMVKVNKLNDDYYVYHEDKRALIGRKRGRTFRLGQSVHLKIDRIDIPQRRLDFDLA